MSRGFGKTQRAIRDYLDTVPFGFNADGSPVSAATWWITEVVEGHRHGDDDRRTTAKATEAERAAVRRALLGLERAGVVERVAHWRTNYWRTTAVTGEVDHEAVAEAERQREARRAAVTAAARARRR